MHDPQTLAFSIKRPWYDKRTKAQREEDERKFRQGRFVFRYRPSWVDIWHVDPERDGSDDSCAWSFIKLTQKQKNRLKDMAWSEARYPYFLRSRTKEWEGSRVLAENLYRALVLYVCKGLRIKITYEEAARMAAERIHRPDCIDGARIFCFLPGYHTNFKEDRESDREYHFVGIMSNIARSILTNRRPWYKHPRWHIHHWRIVVPALQSLKRWAWGKCATCGKGFKWGESTITNTWHGTGPLWFRSERDIHHDRCHGLSAGRVSDRSENPAGGTPRNCSEERGPRNEGDAQTL